MMIGYRHRGRKVARSIGGYLVFRRSSVVNLQRPRRFLKKCLYLQSSLLCFARLLSSYNKQAPSVHSQYSSDSSPSSSARKPRFSCS